MTTYDKSPALGLNLPKGTDTFDYDVFLRQNFNTIDTSLAERVNQMKSIRVDMVADYGADQTGTNFSDTAVSNALSAIVSAINVLSNPPILWFPAGSYKFANPFPTILNKIHIQGAGMMNTVLNFNHTTGAPCITVGNDSADMSFLYWNGFTVNGNSQTGDGIYLNYVISSRFTSINIKNCGGHGLRYEKGWEVRFTDIRAYSNGQHGFYCLAKQEAYSELNDITILEGYFAHNGNAGICVGKTDNTYTAEEGYNVKIRNNYLGNNGWGNIIIAGERNVTIEQNYMEDASNNMTGSPSSDAFHIYVGMRTNSGLGTAHAISIRDNHFNAMNDTHVTPQINNASGYGIILDNVIGATIENNFFYQSVTTSLLIKANAKNILRMPNVFYENGASPYVVDQTNGLQFVDLFQSGNQLQMSGLLTGIYFQQQGFENLIKNGNFELADGSNIPQGFSTQSFTFAKDTDGALICTGTAGGGFQKVQFDIGSRYSQFKGKYVIFCAEVKVVTGTTSNLNMRILDGVSETDLPITSDNTYHDLYIVRKIDVNATKLQFSVSSANGTGTTTDQVYIRNMRAYYGQTPLGYQKAPADHVLDVVSTLPAAGTNYRGRVITQQVNATTADKVFVCLQSATGTFSWVQIATG